MESGALLAGRLGEHVRRQNARANRRYDLSLSVGVAYHDPERPCSLDALLDRADGAMYVRKQEKRQTQGPHGVLALSGPAHAV
jgi:GGDEF domain-containing protein